MWSRRNQSIFTKTTSEVKRVLMNKRGEDRNYGVLIAAIVAIVAIVGLIILFNKGGASGAAVDASDYAGVAEAAQASTDAGQRCGQCAQGLASNGQWDSSMCPMGPDMSSTSGYTANMALQNCCSNECNAIGWKRCMEYCRGAGNEAYGYAHGTGGYGY